VRELILGKDGSILCRNKRNEDVALSEEPSSLDSCGVVLAVWIVVMISYLFA
jgi:hypothetical protein